MDRRQANWTSFRNLLPRLTGAKNPRGFSRKSTAGQVLPAAKLSFSPQGENVEQ